MCMHILLSASVNITSHVNTSVAPGCNATTNISLSPVIIAGMNETTHSNQYFSWILQLFGRDIS